MGHTYIYIYVCAHTYTRICKHTYVCVYVCVRMYNWRRYYRITNWTDCLVSYDDMYYSYNTDTCLPILGKSFRAT